MWPPLLAALAQTGARTASLEPLVAGHCVECHAGEKPKADLNLQTVLADLSSAAADRREDLERVRAVLRAGEMPPPRKPRPPAELVEGALAWRDGELGPALEGPALRRLNRVEYEHAVRDLFGLAYPARESFPSDDVGALFDNDAAGAAASELLVERWVEAA